MNSNIDWDALSEAAQRGELAPTGAAVIGAAAAEQGRTALLNATAAATVEEATRIALGRPRLGEQRETHMWRVRTTAHLDATLASIAQREGRSRSEIIRAAVAEYARAHT